MTPWRYGSGVWLVMQRFQAQLIVFSRWHARALRSSSYMFHSESSLTGMVHGICTSISAKLRCHGSLLYTCRYIKWIQQAYRSGGEKAQLLPLLERCTRELEAFPRYRSDHRYLRLWIRYVRQVAPASAATSIPACPAPSVTPCCSLLLLTRLRCLQADSLPEPQDVFTYLRVRVYLRMLPCGCHAAACCTAPLPRCTDSLQM